MTTQISPAVQEKIDEARRKADEEHAKRMAGLSEADLQLTFDLMFERMLQHYGVSIPSLVAETAYHRYHNRKFGFCTRANPIVTTRAQAVLESLPPFFAPLNLTVGTRAQGLVSIKRLLLQDWAVQGYSSSSQTIIFVRGMKLADIQQESLIGRPLNSVVDAPYLDERPIWKAAPYSMGSFKGLGFFVAPDLRTHGSGDEQFQPAQRNQPVNGPFTDAQGARWENLVDLLEKRPAPVECKTFRRKAMELQLYDLHTFGGPVHRVLCIRMPGASPNSQLKMSGCYYDFSLEAWAIPCAQLVPGELIANLARADQVILSPLA